MLLFRSISLWFTCACLCTVQASAQYLAASPRPTVSPHETLSMRLVEDDVLSRVTVVFGRPYSKDPKTGITRKVWGELIPYGTHWRCGADEATLFLTMQPIRIGDHSFAPGAYSLFLWAEADRTWLIVNRQFGQWGLNYDASQNLARIPMKMEKLKDNVDQFSMAFDRVAPESVVLKMYWEQTQVSVRITYNK